MKPPLGRSGGGREWFGDVVIGSEFEAEYLVNLRVTGGEKEDGNLGALPDGAADIEAGEVGESNIEHDEVRGMALKMR